MAGKASTAKAAQKDTSSTTGKAADTDTASAAKDADTSSTAPTTSDAGGVSNDDVKATGDADKAENAAGDDSERSQLNHGAETDPVRDAAQAASDQLREDIANEQKAVEENPDHPEEAVETRYLVGGEVPANAPGTEGLPRE